MRYFVLLLTLVSILFSLEISKINKELSNEQRAEVFAQNMVEEGYFDDAIEFLEQANKKYKNNAELLRWSGQVYLEKNDLETAKKYFIQVLSIEPTNEIAAMQINLIDKQEEAKANKNIETLLELLSDKGLDFIMIFLAFLGSELLSKRYNICSNTQIYTMADHFIHKKSLSSSIFSRLKLIFNQYTKQKFFSFCFVINLLIITTITLTIMIFWLFVVFHYELTIFLDGQLLTLDADEIEIYFFKTFMMFFFVTIFIRAIMHYNTLARQEIIYEIVFIEELDALMQNGAYQEIYNVMQYLHNNNISKEVITKLLYKYSANPESILKFYIKKKGSSDEKNV